MIRSDIQDTGPVGYGRCSVDGETRECSERRDIWLIRIHDDTCLWDGAGHVRALNICDTVPVANKGPG